MSSNETTFPARLTSTAQALKWIADNAAHLTVIDDVVVQEMNCGRCGGTGIYTHYHGVCYACGGKRSRWTERTPALDYVRKQKRNAAARARSAAKANARHEAKLERQRDMNEAQGLGRITFEENRIRREAARKVEREAKRTEAPEGRLEITGRVVKVEERGVDDPYETLRTVATVVVDAGNGTEWAAWGTVPATLLRAEGFGRGAVVTFTATVKRSDRDPGFAFTKRPTGGKVLEAAPAE